MSVDKQDTTTDTETRKPTLCSKCSKLMSSNGIQWQNLCVDCRKKFVKG